MFDDCTEHELPTGRGTVFARVGGNGPPLLLLHVAGLLSDFVRRSLTAAFDPSGR